MSRPLLDILSRVGRTAPGPDFLDVSSTVSQTPRGLLARSSMQPIRGGTDGICLLAAAVNKPHPRLDVIVTGASGSMYAWRPKPGDEEEEQSREAAAQQRRHASATGAPPPAPVAPLYPPTVRAASKGH